jgi:GNAT superfamily N-acetyltransferase
MRTRFTVGTISADATSAQSGESLREQLLELWMTVTDAGGAVGFVAPADPDDHATELDATLDRVRDGRCELVVLRDEEAPEDEAIVGLAFLDSLGPAIFAHWRLVKRLMVHPRLRGQGAGLTLLLGVHERARGLGLEQLRLTLRDGLGLDQFYGRAGYQVIGRHPGGIRVGPHEDRDELSMLVIL